MLDTLSFSKNMQQAGMAKDTADTLASNLKNLQINQIENLLTKNEFRIFQKEMHYFQTNMNDFRNETKIFFENFKQETKADSIEFKNEIRSDFSKLQEEVKSDIAELRSDVIESTTIMSTPALIRLVPISTISLIVLHCETIRFDVSTPKDSAHFGSYDISASIHAHIFPCFCARPTI
jgi:glutamyl/glutaminyl-tRNA synthetase